MALRSGASDTKRWLAAVDRTTSVPSPESDAVIASGRLKLRKSVSSSGRRGRNGSTTRRVIARGGVAGSGPSRVIASRTSLAIAAASG